MGHWSLLASSYCCDRCTCSPSISKGTTPITLTGFAAFLWSVPRRTIGDSLYTVTPVVHFFLTPIIFTCILCMQNTFLYILILLYGQCHSPIYDFWQCPPTYSTHSGPFSGNLYWVWETQITDCLLLAS